MKSLITIVLKESISFLLRFMGIAFIIRETICRKKVTILAYHNPVPETFEKHMRYLSAYFCFIPLDKLVDAIYSKRWSEIPPKSIVITFDDGYKENALLNDIFRRYNVKPTIYLCSGLLNTNRKFWFNEEISCQTNLKKLDTVARLNILKDTADYDLSKEYSDRQVLNYAEIKLLLPNVNFQSHTRFHPILLTSADEEAMTEIKESKSEIEKITDEEVTHFSYPNGDYCTRDIMLLRANEYKSARTIDCGWNSEETNPYRLKAMYIDDSDKSINRLCAQVIGFFTYVRYARYGSFKGVHPPLS